MEGTFPTMTVNTNDPAISSLIRSLLDRHPEDCPRPRRPQDGSAGVPSQDPVREGEGKSTPHRDGASTYADLERPSEERPAPKKRRLSRSASSLGDAEGEDFTSLTKDDPFLYYSNDKLRLERLLRRELPHVAPPQEPVKRKTKISFEVDPFLSMIYSYPELLDEPSDDAGGW